MIIERLVAGENLNAEDAEGMANSMVEGKFTEAQIGAILVALKMKGETKEEILGLARAMREKAIRISPDVKGMVDSCGTGGDSSNSFNISTAAALVAAGAGVKIAKHGNRSVSSKCGSADVLEELGVKMLEPKKAGECIEKVGFGFLYAPYFHPAFKNLAQVRKQLGVRTVFNIIGPLLNPANAEAQVVGVYSDELMEKMAYTLKELGVKRALVVNSNGLDEISLGKTKVLEVKGTEVEEYEINGAEFGFDEKEIPRVKSKEESAKIIMDVLKGKKGTAREVVLINAAALVYLSGIAGSVKEGIEKVEKALDSGAALEKLEMLKSFGG